MSIPVKNFVAATAVGALIWAGGIVGAAHAFATETVTEWHTWAAPTYVPGLNGHGGADQIGWPQAYLGAGQIEPTCEQTVQQDKYVGTRAQIDAIISDGVLTSPSEDNAVVQDWTFVSGPECEPEPTPTPTETKPPKPEPKHSEHTEGACNADGVYIYTTEYTDTDYKWNEDTNAWEPVVTTRTVTEQDSTHPCATPSATPTPKPSGTPSAEPSPSSPTSTPHSVPTPTHPTKPTPPPAQPQPRLAVTGSETVTGFLVAGLILALGVSFLVWATKRKETEDGE